MISPDPTDPTTLRRAYGAFPSGVTAVCAIRDGVPVGMAASSFVSVSMDPPLVSVSVQHTSTTWPVLAEAPRLGLSVLGSGHGEVCTRLASKDGDRFAGTDHTISDDGAVLIDAAAAWLSCSVHDVVVAGDHDLVLLLVHELEVHEGVAPLVFHASQFRGLTGLPVSA